MGDLLEGFISRDILIYAVLAVGFTEGLMRKTPEAITRWKFAVLSTIAAAILFSFLHSFAQEPVSWQMGLARGGKSAIIATALYDWIKTILLQFISRKAVNGDK